MKNKTYLLAALGMTFLASPASANSFRIQSQAWTEGGRIMHATDTLRMNYNGNWLQSMGVQFTGTFDFQDNWQGAFGIGTQQVYHSLGNNQTEMFALSTFKNYLSEARITYYLGDVETPSFSVTAGNFKFNYNPDIKNLGLYLFRGPVYPGFLISGFKDFHTDTTRAPMVGLHLQQSFGRFRHDLVLTQERELPPSFDWSLGYVAKYKAFEALDMGAGMNFYHVIPENRDLTTPSKKILPNLYNNDSLILGSKPDYHPYEMAYIEVVGVGDTVFYTHQGTKVMAMFSLDMKEIFPSSAWGDKDMIIYGEGAIIGWKNYGTVYKNRLERMPLILGLNIPTFGLLDYLSLEVEWYGAKYRADYNKLGVYNSLYLRNINAPSYSAENAPSPLPVSYNEYDIDSSGYWINVQTGDSVKVSGTELDIYNLTADDIKWSLYFEKSIHKHIRFMGQIANDHLLPNPVRSGIISENAGQTQAFTTLKDWYFMFRMGYYF